MVSRCVRYFFWIALFGTTISDVATISPIWTGNPDVQRTALSTMLVVPSPREMKQMMTPRDQPRNRACFYPCCCWLPKRLPGASRIFPPLRLTDICLDRMEKPRRGNDQLAIDCDDAGTTESGSATLRSGSFIAVAAWNPSKEKAFLPFSTTDRFLLRFGSS
jgi:hypothetical protein